MPRFGDVVGDRVRLNDAGRMIDSEWRSLEERFSHVELDAYVLMPNHLHGILWINTSEAAGEEGLSRILQAFKSLTTRAYALGVRESGWPVFDRRLWQQSYYDRVIREEHELQRIRDYIAANPGRWHEDREYRAWQEALMQQTESSMTLDTSPGTDLW